MTSIAIGSKYSNPSKTEYCTPYLDSDDLMPVFVTCSSTSPTLRRCCFESRGVHVSQSKPEKSRSLPTLVLNFLKHSLQPRLALWHRNPTTFLEAGMSQDAQERASLTFTSSPWNDVKKNPFHASFSSMTRGVR